ncbi:electron transfer flavoprotein subunit beta/FixA family protein [Candidatus Marinimicrobia bacterium]|jgi:electron transfer flavoprotein beta subunit|nr:electron transfer flavoprotein subunit beta/FixA family protein [Candidatus Neomarinimicrobiota bacterium]
MKIAVLVKQVVGSESSLDISPDNKWIDESNATFVMNPPDSYAIEEAMNIKEKIGEGEVVIVSMGVDSVQKVIREALSKGADRGIHIQTEGTAYIDPLNTAKNIVSALDEENFDLILSGLQSDDTGMGQTGVLVGELLNMSTATLAIETDIDSEKIRVKRELESGWFQWVTLESPASISIQSGINQPRYPSLKGIMGAKKKEIKVVPLSLHETKQQVEKISIPQKSKETEIINTDIDSSVKRIVEILKSEVKVF